MVKHVLGKARSASGSPNPEAEKPSESHRRSFRLVLYDGPPTLSLRNLLARIDAREPHGFRMLNVGLLLEQACC